MTEVYIVREMVCDHPFQDKVIGCYFSKDKAEKVKGESDFRIVQTIEVE